MQTHIPSYISGLQTFTHKSISANMNRIEKETINIQQNSSLMFDWKLDIHVWFCQLFLILRAQRQLEFRREVVKMKKALQQKLFHSHLILELKL